MFPVALPSLQKHQVLDPCHSKCYFWYHLSMFCGGCAFTAESSNIRPLSMKIWFLKSFFNVFSGCALATETSNSLHLSVKWFLLNFLELMPWFLRTMEYHGCHKFHSNPWIGNPCRPQNQWITWNPSVHGFHGTARALVGPWRLGMASRHDNCNSHIVGPRQSATYFLVFLTGLTC